MEDKENVYEAIIEEFEALTRDAEKVQRETLKKILQENGETVYLQSYGLDGRTDLDSFKACVPIASHKDFEPYIQRIADGDRSSILTGKPITTLSLSSGTSQGKPKFVPFNDKLMEIDLQTIMTTIAFRNREYPTENGKALDFIYGSKPFKTNGGLTAGTVSSNLYHHSKIKEARAIHTPNCSPDEVMFSPDFNQTLYCHLLCALICRNEVHAVTATFAHSIVQGLRTLELVWEELVTDIRQGTLSEQITVPPVRSAVAKLQLRPDSELANKIYDTCLGLRKLNWYGLIPELFPNAKYVNAIMTGSMEPYLTKLRHYAGGLPLLNGDYVSSEGYIGANANPKLPPELATFAPLPNSCYYEFIPLKQEDSLSGLEPQTVGLTEVKVGDEYEIIITTFAGLYRYRLGDVVKVKGFHNSTPELQFICRKNLLLSINIDKNTERDLQISVDSAAKLLVEEAKQEVVDFTSHVDSSAEPGHYVIFWELSGEANDKILKECCNCLDKSFLDAGYITSRRINAIGPLELRIVKGGTFNKILHHFVGLGTAVSQFKSPRCVGENNTAVLQILSSNVVKSYFSTAY